MVLKVRFDMTDDQKRHGIISAVKELAVSLNRTPFREEVYPICSKSEMTKMFGGYTPLVSAAGLEHPRIKKKKITDEIFIADVPQELMNKFFFSGYYEKTILIAGDMHLPWVHEPTLEKFYWYNKQFKPDIVIQIGDLYDMYAHTRFPKSPNLYIPKEEEAKARARAEEFWKRVRCDNPSARCIQFKGNHDVRPVKRTQEKLPELEHFVEAYMERLFTFEGVETIHDVREVTRIDGIAFHHGYLAQLGQHRDVLLENVVVGHTHKGGVNYRGIRNRSLWELNVGLMGDPDAKVMSYTMTKENGWTLGFGFIDTFGPRFIAT